MNSVLGYGDSTSSPPHKEEVESEEIEGKHGEHGDVQQLIPTSTPVDPDMRDEEVFEIIADPTEVLTGPENLRNRCEADVVEYVLEDHLEAEEEGEETVDEVVAEADTDVHTVDVHATHSDTYSGRTPPNTPVAGSSPRQGSQGGGGEGGLLVGATLGLGSQGGGGEGGLIRGATQELDTVDSGRANLSG